MTTRPMSESEAVEGVQQAIEFFRKAIAQPEATEADKERWTRILHEMERDPAGYARRSGDVMMVLAPDNET